MYLLSVVDDKAKEVVQNFIAEGEATEVDISVTAGHDDTLGGCKERDQDGNRLRNYPEQAGNEVKHDLEG